MKKTDEIVVKATEQEVWNQVMIKASRKGDIQAALEALDAGIYHLNTLTFIYMHKRSIGWLFLTIYYIGADIDCRSLAANDTPLMMAAYYGHHELLQMLIGRKANINAVSMSGNENVS